MRRCLKDGMKAWRLFLSKTEIKQLATSANLTFIIALPSLLMRRILFLINSETTRKSTEKCISVDLFEYTYTTKRRMSFLEYLLIEMFLVLAGADADAPKQDTLFEKFFLKWGGSTAKTFNLVFSLVTSALRLRLALSSLISMGSDRSLKPSRRQMLAGSRRHHHYCRWLPLSN